MKNINITIVLGLLAGITLLYSFSSNPLNGRTGPPCDINLCTNCHNGGGAIDGNLTVAGIPDTIHPNTSYNLTINLTNPNLMAMRAGFQMTAINSDHLGTGTFATTDPNATVQPSGSKQYLEHNPAINFPGSSDNSVSFSGVWTSPDGPIGDIITFCTAGNFANGNGDSSGDKIVQMSFDVQLVPANLSANIVTINEPDCYGYSNGMATIEVSGGTPEYQIEWDNGEQGFTADSLNAGEHTVLIIDQMLDSLLIQLNLNQPNKLHIASTEIMDASNQTSNDGSITISVEGGTPPYVFEWHMGDDVISTDEDLIQVGVGDYILIITDKNGCIFNSGPITINGIISSTENIIPEELNVFPNPFSEYIYIDFGELLHQVQNIYILNSSGQMVYQTRHNIQHIQLKQENFAAGIYFLLIDFGDELIKTKLIKI